MSEAIYHAGNGDLQSRQVAPARAEIDLTTLLPVKPAPSHPAATKAQHQRNTMLQDFRSSFTAAITAEMQRALSDP